MILKVKSKSKNPMTKTISSPTPLIYAILCEKTDIVLKILTRMNASLDIGNVFFIFFYNGI